MTPTQVDATIDVIARAVETIKVQQEDLVAARAKIATLEGKVEILIKYARAAEDHNAECKAACNNGVSCGYEGFLKRTGRRCPECPVRSVIDIMPHKGSA